MARCPDCNKFVSYDTDTEPEIESVEVFDGELQGNVRVVLSCAECGTELKENYQEFTEPIDHECEEVDKEIDEDLETFEVEDSSSTFHERMQTHSEKTGKPIKARYAKKYYGADIAITIKCNKCGESFEQHITTEEQASFFDEV